MSIPQKPETIDFAAVTHCEWFRAMIEALAKSSPGAKTMATVTVPGPPDGHEDDAHMQE